MKAIDLTNDYFFSFLEHEDYFRKEFEFSYYSKPVLYQNDESIIAIAPWGEPGYPTTIIFPYAHYISITAMKKKNFFSKPKLVTWLYQMEDLIDSLKNEYEVVEIKNDPISYVKVQIPDLTKNTKEYKRYWNLLSNIPTINK